MPRASCGPKRVFGCSPAQLLRGRSYRIYSLSISPSFGPDLNYGILTLRSPEASYLEREFERAVRSTVVLGLVHARSPT